jgi:hypothetical protein
MSKLVSFDDYKKKESKATEPNNLLFLTEAKIRAIPAHRNKSEEEILNIRNSLHQFALIMYDLVNVELNKELFNQKVA